LGSNDTLLWDLSKTTKKVIMTELMPYIAGIVTLLFGAGCFLALKELNKSD
jgi:hypothetical protein